MRLTVGGEARVPFQMENGLSVRGALQKVR
jgi:hypothetical protein